MTQTSLACYSRESWEENLSEVRIPPPADMGRTLHLVADNFRFRTRERSSLTRSVSQGSGSVCFPQFGPRVDAESTDALKRLQSFHPKEK